MELGAIKQRFYLNEGAPCSLCYPIISKTSEKLLQDLSSHCGLFYPHHQHKLDMKHSGGLSCLNF